MNQHHKPNSIADHETAMIWAGRGFAAKRSIHQQDMAQGFFEVAIQNELLALSDPENTADEVVALTYSVVALAYNAGKIEMCLEYADKVLALNPPIEIVIGVNALLDMAKEPQP